MWCETLGRFLGDVNLKKATTSGLLMYLYLFFLVLEKGGEELQVAIFPISCCNECTNWVTSLVHQRGAMDVDRCCLQLLQVGKQNTRVLFRYLEYP